jgi:hypothetical protein
MKFNKDPTGRILREDLLSKSKFSKIEKRSSLKKP